MANSPRKAPPQPAFVQEPAPIEEPVAAASVEFAAAPAYEPEPVPAPAPADAPAPVAALAPVVVATPAALKSVEAPLQAMQDKARSLVEKGLVETRANYTKAKSAANEATAALEASYGVAKDGVLEFNVKAIEAIKASADANLDFLKSLIAAKSVSEYVALHTEFTRKQFETAYARAKDLSVLARKVADESVAPIKAHVSKSFKLAG